MVKEGKICPFRIFNKKQGLFSNNTFLEKTFPTLTFCVIYNMKLTQLLKNVIYNIKLKEKNNENLKQKTRIKTTQKERILELDYDN